MARARPPTIGKLAQKFAAEGKSVMLAAGDTFRAAAIEQLQICGPAHQCPPSSAAPRLRRLRLAFDAVTEARAQGRDVLIIDTAGRLQNRDELMNELEKVIRVIKKSIPPRPMRPADARRHHRAECAATGQIFGQRAGVTGLVMTKLDGTARGGILVAIARRFVGLPVHFIGVGEGVGDLEPFTASDFARAIAGRE